MKAINQYLNVALIVCLVGQEQLSICASSKSLSADQAHIHSQSNSTSQKPKPGPKNKKQSSVLKTIAGLSLVAAVCCGIIVFNKMQTKIPIIPSSAPEIPQEQAVITGEDAVESEVCNNNVYEQLNMLLHEHHQDAIIDTSGIELKENVPDAIFKMGTLPAGKTKTALMQIIGFNNSDCAVCLKHFGSQCKRLFWPCGHSTCTHCCALLLYSSQKCPCPICRVKPDPDDALLNVFMNDCKKQLYEYEDRKGLADQSPDYNAFCVALVDVFNKYRINILTGQRSYW